MYCECLILYNFQVLEKHIHVEKLRWLLAVSNKAPISVKSLPHDIMDQLRKNVQGLILIYTENMVKNTCVFMKSYFLFIQNN